jgi:glycosyltransferase involved in cell wall biosynthesis
MPVNLTARRDSLPQIATILDVNFMVEPETYDGWYRAYATRMFARSVRDADMLTTISEYSRTQLAAHLGADPTRVRVVYPGLDSVPTMPTVPPPVAPYALFVGATEPHKNLDLIIDAWSTAPPAGLNLVIAGRPGRDHDRILARAARLGARVAIVGAVDQVRLEHLYRQASVFVFPSLVEGFGYPPLEAMARGIPGVASNAASLPEVLGDAARFHDPRDVDALVRHVTELVEDTEVRAAYIARGLDQAARYAWSSTARTMETAIQELIASRTDRLPHRIENAGNHG